MNRRNVLKSIPALIGAAFIPSFGETDFAKAVRIAENSKGSAAKRLAGFAENIELTLFDAKVIFRKIPLESALLFAPSMKCYEEDAAKLKTSDRARNKNVYSKRFILDSYNLAKRDPVTCLSPFDQPVIIFPVGMENVITQKFLDSCAA